MNTRARAIGTAAVVVMAAGSLAAATPAATPAGPCADKTVVARQEIPMDVTSAAYLYIDDGGHQLTDLTMRDEYVAGKHYMLLCR